MQKYKQLLITALIVLSFIFTAFSVSVADITGGNTIITSPIIGDVTGNSDSNGATNLSNPSVVPQIGDDSTVYENHVTVENGGDVTGDAYGGFTYGGGDVYDNTVTIDNGGSVDYWVSGGYSEGDGVVSGNSVSIANGGAAGYVYGGYSEGDGDVIGNSVESNASGSVCGGYAEGNGAVIGNTVSFAGAYAYSAYGGQAYGDGDVIGNSLEISGFVEWTVYGGYTGGNGDVTGNRVEISGMADHGVYGGIAYGDGVVSGNMVSVISGGYAVGVYGGKSDGTGDVIGNNVEIRGTVRYAVYGGFVDGLGNAIGNSVEISGTVERGDVYGGRTYNGRSDVGVDAIGNSVEISGTVERGDVYGGYSDGNGNVVGNTVSISSDGTVDNDVYGGFAGGVGGIISNSVEISGTVNNVVYGGYTYSDGNITSNRVSIASGGYVGSVYGGWSYGDGDITDNSIEIKGTVSNVYGGLIDASWGLGNGDITGNTISIASGGTANYVYGGYSDGSGGWGVGNGNVTGNIVEISGTINNEAYGGWSDGTGSVSNNTITIQSSANLANASLFGRNNNSAGGTGNTLNVNSFVGDVVEVNNFDTYNITIGQLDSSLTVINITGSTPTDIENATINIYFAPEFAYNALNSGDVITVISNINLPTYTGNDPTVMVASSSFVTYDYIETHDTGQLLLTLTGLSVNPETSFVGEGFAAGLAFLGQAADVRSSIYFVPQGPRFIPFAKMVYGKQYISTGSSVNVKGFSAIAGLALNTNFDNGSQLVVGAFVEGGWGDYDSRNSFSNSASIKGNGDTEYYGGGLLARYATGSGLYGEGTFAAGKTETDFKTHDFTPGTRSKYDYSVPYYSAHLALGKIFNMCDIFSLDIYGKYLWTRQGGDNVTMDGYRFKFKDADSHRLRAGGKLHATGLPQLQPYAGAAYEYEFSGKVKGSLSGMNLGQPSLRGGTGIGELGLVWSPTESGNFKVDLGAQGYVGKREGVSGGLTVTMSF